MFLVRQIGHGCLRSACHTASLLTGHHMGSVSRVTPEGQAELLETLTLAKQMYGLQCLMQFYSGSKFLFSLFP